MQDCEDQHWLDYNKTFNPVIESQTIQMALLLAISSGWSVRQLDVKSYFLHGYLDEVVYMKQPPGFKHLDFPNYVCCLKKAIYGLK